MRSHDQRTGPQTVTRFAGQRVGGDKGCGTVLPKSYDQRTGPQTVTRFAGQRVGGDKGCGTVLPKSYDQRTGPQTVTRFAGHRVGGDKGETLFFDDGFVPHIEEIPAGHFVPAGMTTVVGLKANDLAFRARWE